MSKPVALRAKRTRSGYASASSHREHSALGRAVSAVIEPLERRVLLSAVEISGQSVGFVGKSLTFNADAGQNASNATLSYQWSLLNQYGSAYVPPGGLPNSTMSSFVVPGSVPAGSYAVDVAVSSPGAATQTATFPVEVLSDPQGNLLYGTVPSVEGTPEAFASAMVRQPDGKIVAAGFWGDPRYDIAYDDHWSGWWIARFNPDLTLDTSFKNVHGGASSFFPANAVPGYFSSIQQLAINPNNQDIIVVGTGTNSGIYTLQVAELVSKETVEPNGTVVEAGSFDPNFNGGIPFYYAPPPPAGSSGSVFSCGEAVDVLPNGDLLVGGGSDVFTGGLDQAGSAASGSDFLLLAITPGGALDPNFNGTGVAQQPGVSGLYDANGTTFYPSSRIFSLSVDGQGNIYAGGVGSPPAGSAYASDSEGIVIVRYSSSGIIDTSFGTGGHAYTDSSAFNGGTSGGSAFLSAMELTPGGQILIVGQANSEVPDPYSGTSPAPTAIDAHVVLARYDPNTGALDGSYGSNGIANTSIHFDSVLSPNSEASASFAPYTFGTGSFPQNLGSFVFRSDGSVVGSLATDSGWELVQFAGSNALAGEMASLTIPINSATADWSFFPDDNPGTLVVTGDSIIAAGTITGFNLPFRSPDTLSGGGQVVPGGGTFSQPLVLRYLLQGPAAGNLTAQQTSSGAVSLSWNVTLPGQTGFQIERSTAVSSDGSTLVSPQLLGQVGPTQTDYVDASASPDTQYYYQCVPVYSPGGTQQSGQASNVAAIYTADPKATTNVFQEAVQVPLNGASVTSATTLQAGHYYVIVASGLVHLDSGVLGDPAHWYSAANPQNANGSQLSNVVSTTSDDAATANYGLAIGTVGSMAIPAWGIADPDHHSYFRVVQGTGAALTVALQGVANFASTANVASGDRPLEVEIYEMNGTPASPPPPAQTSGGVAVLQLSVPTIGSGTVLPVLSQPAAVDALAAATDSSQVPWQLWLDGNGGSALLAQSNSSIGSLPSSPGVVTTLNPQSFPDGVYTLRLTTNYAAPQQNYSATYQLVLAAPVLRITLPATAQDGVTPVVGASTPINVLAGNPDGSQAAWSLHLVSTANATNALLASSAGSVGTLPDFGSTVATLDPSLYPNGTYQLRLENGQGVVVDSRTITIATAVKKGTLELPVTDATLNTVAGPIAISRTYDSGLVNVPPPTTSDPRPIAPNFGPGWSFSLLDSRLTTSAEADTVNPGSGNSVLRAGDLVYLTVPDGGRHVFEFDPIPLEEPTTFAGSQSSIAYEAEFIQMDGSGATLTVNFISFFPYFHQVSNNLTSTVYYDPADNEFGYPGSTFTKPSAYYGNYQSVDDTTLIGFDPAAVQHYPAGYGSASPAWTSYDIGGGTYQLTNKDGTSYTIDALTGAIETVADQNGNSTTYTYASGSVTAKDSLGRTLFTVLTNAGNQVTSVQIAGQNPITYGYANGNLASVVNQVNQQTLYSYQNSSFPHFVTGMTNAIGQQVLGARYDANGLLDQLTNASGVTIPVSYGQLGSDQESETVVDAAGNITTDVLDERYGTLLRKIQTVTDSSQNVQDYIVSLTNYNYANDDVGQISALRPSGVQVLQSIQTFAPFEIQGTDAAGLRFTQQPAGNAWAAQTTYDTANDLGSAAYQQILSTSQRLTDAGALQTTLYGNYTITDAARHTAKPGLTTVEVQTPDAAQPTGYDNQVQSQTYAEYDSNGKLLDTVVAVGRDFGSASRNPGVGVYSDVVEGNYPATLYVTLSGFSISADNTVQTLTWNASASAYKWNDGSTIGITLTDTSLVARGSGTPLGGDLWTLSVSDAGAGPSNDGLLGQLANLTFDGTPGALSALLATFFAGNPFTDETTHQPVSGDQGLMLVVPGWLGLGTQYSYTSLSGGTGSVVDKTYSATANIAADGTVSGVSPVSTQSENTYYDSNDYTQDPQSGAWIPNPGAAFGAVKYSFGAAGQETYYGYDQAGHTILQYVYKQWTNPAGNLVNGWVGTTNVYDAAGRQTDTYQATYVDPNADTSQSIAFQAHILPVIAGGPAGIQVDTNSSDSAYVTVYAAPLRVTHNDYNALGQLADTIDQYGGQTTYTYDANGNKIRTVYPNGTEMRSIYDPLNRVIWATNQYDPTGSNLPILTHTIYNQLGQTIETDTFDGGTIQIGSEQVGTGTVGTATINTTVVNGVVTPAGGTLASVTKMFYDAAGHAIETISPSGLRTGTIYTPDGKALYAGPLNASAPDGGRPVTTYEGVTSNEFSTSDFQVDSATGYTQTLNSQYDPALGLFYTRTVDQNGHHTNVYTDALGRTVRTAYDDGSFAETLYGIGDSQVTVDQEGDAIPTPSTWQGIIVGGSETISLAQRKAGDPIVPTYRVSDAKGNLIDVYQPAVADGDPNSPTYYPTYGQLVNPLTVYGYDVASDETSQTDAAGHVTGFAYDPNGNQVRQLLPDGEAETSTYNANSQITGSTDFDSNTAAYTYFTSGPHAGLLSQVVYAGASGSGKATQTVTYGYDDLNRRQSVTDASGTTTDSYDDFGNLTQEQTPEGTIHYAFDPATGNHLETYTANTQTWYGYDLQNRLTSVTVKELNGQTLGTPLVQHNTYDPAGNELTESDPNGEVTTYGYDDLNRLTAESTVNGGSTLFSQTYVLNHNGTRASSSVSQLQPDGSTVTTATAWTYDALQRLTQEIYASSAANENYTDVFGYDVASNRMSRVHTGPGGGANETTTFAYSGDNELTSQTSSLSGTTTNTYDANGSLTTSSIGGVVTATYTYDARNKMVGYSSGSTVAAYVYDDAGDRVQETVNGVTTFYLTDTQNPTRYDQPVEQKSSATATPSVTNFLGDRAFGQADGSANVSYLLADGHGSTQQLTNAAGTVTAAFRYDAFGTALNFTPGSAGTAFLFGGDAVYDPASGLYLHGNGVRPTRGFLFIQRDFGGNNSNNQDPLSLHTYLYAEADPIMGVDPSGHNLVDDLDLGDALGGGEATNGGDGNLADDAFALAGEVQLENVAGYEKVNDYATRNFGNVGLASALGFAQGDLLAASTSLDAQAVAISAGMVFAGAVGGIVTDWVIDALYEEECAFGCFLAGTDVLLGNRSTEEPIQDIHVGDRVATDGGAANSPTGTAAPDPNATAVKRKTWREITITAGDWQVQTLEPLSWIKGHHLKAGSVEPLSDFVNVAEMGVPDGLLGVVQWITTCPKIQKGPGRVVLTTVSHLNNDLYTLTLKDAAGVPESLGVTGYHRFYDQSLGWTQVQNLYAGETLRGANGNLMVVSVTRTPGTDRVYNMTVEADHVYYVGDLQPLVHNSCLTGRTGAYIGKFKNGMMYIGKGDYLRAIQSIISRVAANGGLESIGWQETATELEGFIQEAEWIAENGGIDGGSLLNLINSPGAAYL